MGKEGKRCSAYASRHHRLKPIVTCIAENDCKVSFTPGALPRAALRTYRNFLVLDRSIKLRNHRESLLSLILSVVLLDQETNSSGD